MSNDSNVNAVRQVLMNELGFTRESVRDEMIKIVSIEASKVVTKMFSENIIEKIVSDQFIKFISSNKYSKNNVELLCIEAAKKAAETFVSNNLKFSVTKDIEG